MIWLYLPYFALKIHLHYVINVFNYSLSWIYVVNKESVNKAKNVLYLKKMTVLVRCWVSTCCQNSFNVPWHWFYKSVKSTGEMNAALTKYIIWLRQLSNTLHPNQNELWWLWSPQNMIHIIFTVIKPFSDFLSWMTMDFLMSPVHCIPKPSKLSKTRNMNCGMAFLLEVN